MTMISLSMKSHPALLCEIIFVFFCLEMRSAVTTSSENIIVHTTAEVQLTTVLHRIETQDITHAHTHKPPAEVNLTTASLKTQTPAVVNINRVTTATSTDGPELPPNSRDQTITPNEGMSGHSQSGTEILTGGFSSTESPLKVTLTEVKSAAAPSTLVPKTEPRSPSMLRKNGTILTTLAPSSAGLPPLSTKSTMTDTTSATTVTNKPTLLPNVTATSLGPTTKSSATEIALPAIPGKNTTGSPLNQTTATTELPSSTVNPTNGTTVVSHTQTTSYIRTTTPPKTTTDHLTSQSTPKTSVFTTEYYGKASTTGFSTIVTKNTTVLIPIIPKKMTTSKPNHTLVTDKPLSTTAAQPCSSIGIVKQCLIIITTLAVVATIFIICTIVLCTKLSSKKYKINRHHPGTEMMCISSLLPEKNHHYTRQRNPVPNGVLVIPNCEDSDDELGDNLTLSSFLPDNDRYV